MDAFYAVIMAGGSGTRFWPLSRRARPKQVLSILGGPSMIRRTVDRLAPAFDTARILVITAREQAGLLRAELPLLPAANILEEPVGRDTAAAIGLAAVEVERRSPGGSFAVLPADHYIDDPSKLQAALEQARLAARGGILVAFGIPPRYPATCYGYLRRGEPLGRPGVHRVARFCEKPPLATAEAFLKEGGYFWNGGIFVWEARSLLDAVAKHLPELSAGLREIAADPGALDRVYAKLPRISIDYGVMEKADRVAMVEAPFEWDDVGSWSAAADRRPRDARGNAFDGDVVAADVENSLVLSAEPGHVVGVLGLEDVVVVHTPDATLVCSKRRAEDLKVLVEALKAKGHERLL